MKIQQLHLNRYGPPLASGLDLNLDDFTLVYGNNEDGKTLAIEALLKLFYDSAGSRKLFSHIDRVDEEPEGYVVLEDENEEKHKMSGDETLEDLLDVSARDCRNVFVIRDGDLSMSEQGKFFASVTDRLTGLRTSEIEELRETVIELARLKPSGTGYSNRQEDDKLKDRVEAARDLLEDLEELETTVSEQELDELEKRRVRLKEEMQRTEQQIQAQEDAERRERYEKARSALDDLQEARRRIRELSDYTRQDWQQWRDSSKQAKDLRDELEDLHDSLEAENKELDETSTAKKEQQQTVHSLKKRWEAIKDEAKQELEELKDEETRLAGAGAISGVVRPAAYISAGLLSLSLIGLLTTTSGLFTVATIILSISTAALWGYYGWTAWKRSTLESRLQALRQTLAENGLDGEELQDMLQAVNDLKEKLEQEQEKLNDLEVQQKTAEKTVKNLRDSTIPDHEEELKTAEETVEKLKNESGVSDLQEYREKLDEKQDAQKRADEKRASLESLLGPGPDGEGEQVEFWREKLADLEEYSDRAPDVDYDEQQLTELKQRRTELNEELEQSADELTGFEKKLNDIGRRARETLPGDTGDVLCQASSDLTKVKERLKDFLDEARLTREAGEGVVSVLEALNREEKEQISRLFGPDSRAAGYFHKASGGAYDGLRFDQETGAVMVSRPDGTELKATDLSGGAYDQLYLSIRLAIGEQLLGGETGFFILDDPFVRADPQRLEKQMDVLRDLTDRGWQVIYFSAKGEVRNLLKPDIESGDVNLQALSNRQLGGS